MSILHGDFALFWSLSGYDLPYQTQHRLVNIVKYELGLLFNRDNSKPLYMQSQTYNAMSYILC